MTDKYRELEEAARDALGDLLRASEPGTGLYLHTAYAQLKHEIAEREAKEARKAEAAARRSLEWGHRSTEERDREVLGVLAEHRLTISELTGRLTDQHPDLAVYDSHVRGCVTRLFHARELDRRPETFAKTKTRFRYFKRTALDGPISDLESAFHTDAEAA